MSSMKSISRHKSFRFDLTLILACVYFFASLLMFLIFKINNKCSFCPFSLFIRFPLSSSFLRSPRGPWVGGVISRRSETVVSRSLSLYSLIHHTVRNFAFSHSNYNEKLIKNVFYKGFMRLSDCLFAVWLFLIFHYFVKLIKFINQLNLNHVIILVD